MTRATSITRNPANRLELAISFAKVLRESLGEDCVADVVAKNAQPGRCDDCATHDYCDANEAMARAFEVTFGRPPLTSADVEDAGESESVLEADTNLWNSAWDLAKRGEFLEQKIQALAGGVGHAANDATRPTTSSAAPRPMDLALAFAQAVCDQIGEAKLARANSMNAAAKLEDLCATNEFCDSDTVLAGAFIDVFGRKALTTADVSTSGEAAVRTDGRLLNEARVLARAAGFDKRKIQELADERVLLAATHAALDEACRRIQEHLGRTAGDVAGNFFTGESFDSVKGLLGRYLRAERGELEHRPVDASSCIGQRVSTAWDEVLPVELLLRPAAGSGGWACVEFLLSQEATLVALTDKGESGPDKDAFVNSVIERCDHLLQGGK